MAKVMLQKEQVGLAFGTPISAMIWPDSDTLNADLKSLILAREKASGGVTRSNVGGWHSEPDLLLWKHASIAALQERIVSSAGEMTRLANAAALQNSLLKIDCWANVSRRGHYNSLHDHPASTWSGVYYVACGMRDNDDAANGKLELIDPRVGINMARQDLAFFGGRYLVDPIPGLMVMFPSWLKHMVHPYAGNGERIAVSFNVRIEPKP